MNQKPAPVSCSSGCKATAKDADEASNMGWEVLPITGRWRCSACYRALRSVNQISNDRENA